MGFFYSVVRSMRSLPGYLFEIWLCPDYQGQLLPACLDFGPAGDPARELLESGSICFLVFWANSRLEAMQYYYSVVEYGIFSSDDERDFEPFPDTWFAVQQAYVDAL